MMKANNIRESWGTKFGFVLAAAGSAIGLGNIWKFPFITGQYGGAAFVLVYLICIALIGFPIMLAELVIGRKSHRNPVGAFNAIRPGSYWRYVGMLGVLSGFVILSYYSVVAGWTMAYIFKAATGIFSRFSTPAQACEHFTAFARNPFLTILFHAIFMGLTATIVARGVKGGIERWSKILMPALFIILILLVARGLTLKGAGEGIRFLFRPDISKITGEVVLVALGHAFFTLSLGMGAMITYGSYLSKETNLVNSSLWIVALDTVIALLAGIAIFTAVFAMKLEPDAGPALIFNVLPAVFNRMPFGTLFGILFFLLLAIAALTSGISLLEVATAYFIDEKGWSRSKAASILGLTIFLLGIPAALSTGLMKNITLLKMTFFDMADYLSFKYMLPVGGLLTSIFIGWKWGTKAAAEEIKTGTRTLWVRPLWTFLIKFISPILIFITLIAGLLGKL